ncbi:YceI family protein [Burkholderia sp. FERM BP-3421]|uniref:YceI family protein n=1 Tax=Burkholderia sp. FERM BP-3421 TaxID=1494466 RepID=UPI002361AD13|nr:YceI family protein [Burkholderia sp. FERM BP-3421]WDD90799.1 YceI family protein [Burkholderia sp. FERM BP-3421]
MRASTLIAAALAAAAGLAATTAGAAWHVDNAQSSFSFVTTKAGAAGTAAIEEVQSFRQVGGTVADDGALHFTVDLASVDTRIGLRDERIKTLLFKVAEQPRATFAGSVDPRHFEALPVGASTDLDLDGSLTLAGKTHPLTAPLRVVKLADQALLVTTRTPVIVNLKDYGLQDGVDALRTLMNLNVLSGSAPVSFSVVLRTDR